jgi:hypothetical protein
MVELLLQMPRTFGNDGGVVITTLAVTLAERGHAAIGIRHPRILIRSATASLVAGSRNGLSESRSASRHHSSEDILLAGLIGLSGGASYRVPQPVKANPSINTVGTRTRRSYGQIVN